MEFKDKCVIVTGSARGIGREIALKFGAEGANVVVFDINIDGQDKVAQSVCDEIKALGGDAKYILGDVSKPDDTDKLIDFAKSEFGSIDVIVNNAGITRDNLIMRMSEADWDAVLTVNLKGAFNVIKSATRTLMKQRCGNIINMASVSGVMGNAGQANYSASKAGLIGLTKSVAKELAGRGVTANAVAPGYIATDMTSVLPDKVKDAMKAQIPAKRIGTPDDVADVVAFLCSDDAAYVTGEVIRVDGGLAM